MLVSSQSNVSQSYQTSTATNQPVSERQSDADKAAKSDPKDADATHNGPRFLANAMEELLANKMGVDKEQLDKLKEEIEALQELDDPTEQQQKRLTMLTEHLGEMVREAAERAAEQQAKQDPQNKLGAYRATAALTSLL